MSVDSLAEPQPDAGPASGESRADPKPWYPPSPPWLTFLLCFFTFGLYAIVWIARLAINIRDHVDPEVRPWRYWVGSLVLGFNFYFFYRAADHIAQLNASVDKAPRPSPGALLALFMVLYLGSMAWTMIESMITQSSTETILIRLAIQTLPWVILQRQLNQFLATLGETNWAFNPRRQIFRRALVILVGAGLMVLLHFLVELANDEAVDDRVAVGSSVSGSAGIYTLQIRDPNWMRIAPNTVGNDTDFELFDPDTESWVIVFLTHDSDWTIDDMVDYRRNAISKADHLLSSSEERVILPGSEIVVSYARYRQEDSESGELLVGWVASVVLECVAIEVYGEAPKKQEDALKRLVHSLALSRPESEICSASQ